MSWKEVLKPSLAEFGPVDVQTTTSRLSVCSDGQENLAQGSVDGLYETGDKLCCGLELPCLPGPSGSGSTFELVCVDEWLKTRTESLSSMDMDVAMKSDGIDANYLSDSGVSKENPNLSELDQFLTPKGAVDLCIVNEVCGVGVGGSRKRLGDLGEAEDSGLLLSDDLLLKEGPSSKKALWEDEGGVKEKDDDGLGRRGSWADSLELGKDKANWESMSNASHRSHELEKDVDFPEFNLVPSFDPLCSIECSLPVSKELEEASALDKDSDLSVIPVIVSKPDEPILQEGDPVLPSIHDSLEPLCSLRPPRSLTSSIPLIAASSSSSTAISLLKSPLSGNNNKLETDLPETKSKKNVAAVIISRAKDENTTQIVIKTSRGSVFKANDVIQRNISGQERDDEVSVCILRGVSMGEGSEETLEPSNSGESEEDSGSEEVSEDQLAVDLAGDKPDSGGEGVEEPEDEQPLIEALSEIGIKVDSLVSVTTLSGQKLWVCPERECGKTFPRQSMLKVHILAHYGIRPYKCDFEGCFWSFYTYFKLKRHKATHLKKKDFQCTVEGCGRRFTTIYNLNTHSKLHDRPNQMVCTVPGCDASFQTRRRLENHLKEHDVCHAPYRCPYCGKPYYSSNSLNAHIRSHEHKEEEVRCSWSGCGKLFDKPCRLRAHIRTHTGDRPYSCGFEGCGWSFSSASKLKRHQQKHTDERKFKCNVAGCTKAFLRSEHLREHLITHAGSRFYCPVEGCGVKFTAKSSLYVHMKKHQSQEKSMYTCPVEHCDKKYHCRSSMRHHVLKTHPLTLGDESPITDMVTYVAADDDQDILLDGSALVDGAGVILDHEPSVVLSTINPADIMLTELSVSTAMLSNGILSVAEESAEEEGSGCARTNLPLPLVPRRTGRGGLGAPPPTLLSDDLFSDPLLATAHTSGIEFQIMLDSRQRDFSESTINLRDLD